MASVNDAGYVYVATSHELMADDIAKIGFTRNIRSRLKHHRNNSSSPYELFCFACFRFGHFEDARRAETWVKRELRKLNCKYEDKTEFFRISASAMCAAIEEAIETLKLSAIGEFPSEFDNIINKTGDFVSMPEELLECLTTDEARAYWQGAKEMLWVFSRLGGTEIGLRDFSELRHLLDFNVENNAPSIATTVALHFRNHHLSENRVAGEKLSKEISDRDQYGFSRLPGDFLISNWREKHASSRRESVGA